MVIRSVTISNSEPDQSALAQTSQADIWFSFVFVYPIFVATQTMQFWLRLSQLLLIIAW
jgi:hypothetical protein